MTNETETFKNPLYFSATVRPASLLDIQSKKTFKLKRVISYGKNLSFISDIMFPRSGIESSFENIFQES